MKKVKSNTTNKSTAAPVKIPESSSDAVKYKKTHEDEINEERVKELGFKNYITFIFILYFSKILLRIRNVDIDWGSILYFCLKY